MDRKKCSKCHVVKSVDEFSKEKWGKNGLNSQCKSCLREKRRVYKENNKEELALKRKIYYEDNKEKMTYNNKMWNKNNKDKAVLYAKKYAKNNKDKLALYQKIWNEKNKDKMTLYHKKYSENNKEKRNLYYKEYSKNNKAKIALRGKVYNKNNREKINEIIRIWGQKQRDIGSDYAMSMKIRSRILSYITKQGCIKSEKTEILIGASLQEVQKYLSNLGYIYKKHDIDHIIPLSVFNYQNHEHRKVMFNYCNLSPEDPYYNRHVKRDLLLHNWKEIISNICLVVDIDPGSIIDHIDKLGKEILPDLSI